MIREEADRVSADEGPTGPEDASMVAARAEAPIPALSGVAEAPSLSTLLEHAARGDRQAFRGLFVAMGPRLKGFVLSRCHDPGLAEEITQEVLLTVWRRADRFDASRASAETWIFTIARNKVIDRLRHRKVVEADQRDPHFVPDPPAPLDTVIEAGRRAERIRAALAELPEPQRDVLEQAFYAARSYPEIAESQGVALGTVKSRARLAFQRLRELLAGEDVP